MPGHGAWLLGSPYLPNDVQPVALGRAGERMGGRCRMPDHGTGHALVMARDRCRWRAGAAIPTKYLCVAVRHAGQHDIQI